MLGLFLFNLVNEKYIFDSYKADKPSPKNWELNPTVPPHPSYFFIEIFSFLFSFLFSFFFPKSHRLFWVLQLISHSFSLNKNTFHQKTWYFFLPSLPASCLSLSRQVSRINKLTFRKITKVQVGCLRGESLNVRWNIRLQKVSIKVTVKAAFACPGRFAFIVRAVLGAASIPGREVWFPLSAFCVPRSAAAPVPTPETTPPVSAW